MTEVVVLKRPIGTEDLWKEHVRLYYEAGHEGAVDTLLVDLGGPRFVRVTHVLKPRHYARVTHLDLSDPDFFQEDVLPNDGGEPRLKQTVKILLTGFITLPERDLLTQPVVADASQPRLRLSESDSRVVYNLCSC